MKALLLAGGYGTRLRPVTNTIPKCLVEIKGKPLLEYWLEVCFWELNCQQVLINTHYLADEVREYVVTSRFRDSISLVHEEVLLGTLNTVKYNDSDLASHEILIAHADNFCRTNWAAFLKVFRERGKEIHMTMMTFDTDTPNSCGMVELCGEGRIRSYVEKPTTRYDGTRANGAVFLLDKLALTAMCSSSTTSIDLCKDFIPAYLEHINCFHNENVHIDIGSMEKLLKANEV